MFDQTLQINTGVRGDGVFPLKIAWTARNIIGTVGSIQCRKQVTLARASLLCVHGTFSGYFNWVFLFDTGEFLLYNTELISVSDSVSELICSLGGTFTCQVFGD